MSYRLEAGEPVADGIRRIINEQIDQALESLTEQTETDPDEAIHDARKRFKKVRAVLRLVRDEIGEDVYQSQNVYYRDLGRMLSAVRDSAVMVETVEDLREHYAPILQDGAFSSTVAAFRNHHQALAEQVFRQKNVPVQVAESLKDNRFRIDALPIQSDDFSAFEDGLERVYKRGYKGFDNAYDDPTAENFHEWRKRVKYLWYHARILRPLWPDPFAEWADEIHDLADYLGDEHDLAELRERLWEGGETLTPDHERQVLLQLVEQRRAELQQAAEPLGTRIYAEDPEDFTYRIATYWDALENELALASPVAQSAAP